METIASEKLTLPRIQNYSIVAEKLFIVARPVRVLN